MQRCCLLQLCCVTAPALLCVMQGSVESSAEAVHVHRYKLENAPERDNKAIGALKKRFGPLHVFPLSPFPPSLSVSE